MPDVRISRMGAIGRITLSRPKSLNSLTENMISEIENALENWRDNINVLAVVIDAEGEKAFCAGGDITDIFNQAKKGNFKFGQNFWSKEYRLNLKIARYPKPYIAFMQGFTMGGGVGISCHGSHRIVGENSIISMPECGIGLVPDVGGSHLLARLDNNIGVFLGTTAYRMNVADSIFCKFADYYIPTKFWPVMIENLADAEHIETVINKYRHESPDSPIKKLVESIDEVMSPPDYKQLEERMLKHPKLLKSLQSLQKNSPLSVAYTYLMLQLPEVANKLESALQIEYRYTSRAQEKTDFIEGIRAMVIDKDQNPQWMHRSLSEVDVSDVKSLLAPAVLNLGRS